MPAGTFYGEQRRNREHCVAVQHCRTGRRKDGCSIGQIGTRTRCEKIQRFPENRKVYRCHPCYPRHRSESVARNGAGGGEKFLIGLVPNACVSHENGVRRAPKQELPRPKETNMTISKKTLTMGSRFFLGGQFPSSEEPFVRMFGKGVFAWDHHKLDWL